MSRRRQLEHEVSVAQERIKKAAKDTPKDILNAEVDDEVLKKAVEAQDYPVTSIQ